MPAIKDQALALADTLQRRVGPAKLGTQSISLTTREALDVAHCLEILAMKLEAEEKRI